MGNVNSTPVISQCKSAVQAINGDKNGALQTQIDFSKHCVIVSQIRSGVQLCTGKKEDALQTQIEYGSGIDAIPIFSQVKSLIQFATGDRNAALETQDKFSKECVLVSQVRSIVEACSGNVEGAKETQKQFLKGPGLAHAAVFSSFAITPFAASASVSNFGFTPGGIESASHAAALMASYSGYVPKGSLCAILQSFGAAGMPTSISVALSSLSALSVTAAVAAAKPLLENTHELSPVEKISQD